VTWRAIVRNDLRESVQSRGAWVLVVLFVLGFGGVTYAVANLTDPTADAFFEVATFLAASLLPLIGVVLGYRAISSERESGRVALLLSLPHSRTDMLVGKLLGRTVVLGAAFLVGAVGAGVVLAISYEPVSASTYLLYTLATLLYTLVFVAIAAGLSLAASSTRRVVGAAFGAYVGLVMFWPTFVDVGYAVLFRFRTGAFGDLPSWVPFAKFLSPRTAFVYLLDAGLGVGGGVSVVGLAGTWYATSAGALSVLCCWLVVPLLLGLWRFERSDL
jgi:ABC-2 type transport system permease protein